LSISVFDLYSIGIGPSSSHTIGPMRAAVRYGKHLQDKNYLDIVETLIVDLYGSLALTGKGHATDVAVLLGLEGELPEEIDPDQVPQRLHTIREEQTLFLMQKKRIRFREQTELCFHREKSLPFHPNGMRFRSFDKDSNLISEQIYYSVGGGFVVDHDAAKNDRHIVSNQHDVPYPFSSGEELLHLCKERSMNIADLMMENEKSWKPEESVCGGILQLWRVMQQSVARGCSCEGLLPGGLKVRRRAKGIHENLIKLHETRQVHPSEMMEWVSLWALAVNEENAAGGRIVTAPTNGAAGVIPAVLHYYQKFTNHPSDNGIVTFFLASAAVGILYKENASISAAEMGCMGEVGVACSMAAAGLAAALGGTPEQIENAAEIGMEHNLGLTCDPVMGLVQVPCIERNTMGAIKAINACLLALRGDGSHRVSLDQVIASMRETGRNMQSIYKETSLGGLAVNVPEC